MRQKGKYMRKLAAGLVIVGMLMLEPGAERVFSVGLEGLEESEEDASREDKGQEDETGLETENEQTEDRGAVDLAGTEILSTEQETEQETDRETKQETESIPDGSCTEGETETVQESIMVELKAQEGQAEITVRRTDGKGFPGDSRIWFLSAEDAALGDAAEKEKIEKTFYNEWIKEWESRHPVSEEKAETGIKGFWPYYVKITDTDGNELPGDMDFTLTVRDQEFIKGYEDLQNACYLGVHHPKQPLEIQKSTCTFSSESADIVKIKGSIKESGWLSIVLADADWILKEEGETETEAQTGEEPGGQENGNETESPGLQTEESETESPDRQTEEAWEEEPGVGILLDAAPRSVAFGTRLPTGGFVGVSSGMNASAQYNGIIFRKGISSMELFGTASSKLVRGDLGNALYWQPVDANQKNVCGAIYRKVLYNNANHQWYDVKITLQSYTSSVVASDKKSHTCYPYVGFYKNSFIFSFYRAGMFVVRCEVINSTSGKKEKVKFRLNITDIDDYQVCGFKLGDGSIDGRYCMSNSVVSYTPGVSIAGVGGFEQLVGDDGTIDASDHRGDVIYDVSASEFYLGIGYGNNDKKSWTGTIKPRYDKAIAGTLSGEYAVLGIVAKSTILPVEIPSPVKKVSNDGKTWGNSNVLSSAGDMYWYQVEQFVPEEAGSNYYNRFVIGDKLPKGVYYAGNVSVVRMEDGKNVSAKFTCSAEGGAVTATALSAALGAEDFYGYHYILQFQARMNVAELSPEIGKDEKKYTVKNTAYVTAMHKTDKGETKKESQTVSTVAVVKAPPICTLELTKEIDASDVVFAHGNPVFVFKAEGTDIQGTPRTYFQVVEFEEGNGGNGEKRRLTAVLKVRAGTYTVTEERTMRYRLETIYNVTGGRISGDSVLFDLTEARNGSAVFYNKKITDKEQSHTDLVRNHIGKE